MWRTVDAFVDHLHLDGPGDYLHVDVRAALDAVMLLFWISPTRDEVASWSRFPWEVGQGEHVRMVPLAEPARLWRLAREVVTALPSVEAAKQARGRLRRSEWQAASLALSSLPAAVAHHPRAASIFLAGRTLRRLKRVIGRNGRTRAALRRLLGLA